MKVKPLAVAFALGIMGVIYMLVVNYYPMFSQLVLGVTKGETLRALMEDIYPYYTHTVWYAPLLGSIYGFIDAFFFGLIVAWLYNVFACGCKLCCCDSDSDCCSTSDCDCVPTKARVLNTPAKKTIAKAKTTKAVKKPKAKKRTVKK